jgi:O-antigen ligase
MLRSLGADRVWKGIVWVGLPALAAVSALALEFAPKWQLFYVATVFAAIPVALTMRDVKLWLFLAGAVSAFNFMMIIGEPSERQYENLAVGIIDVPIVMMLMTLFLRATSEGNGSVHLAPSVRRVLLLGLVFVGWLAFGAVSAPRPNAALFQVVAYTRMFLALGVVAACATDGGRVRWALYGLFLALFAQSAIAGAQFATGSSFGLYEHFEESTAAGTLTRSGGTLNPTVLSEYIGVVAPLVLGAALTATRPLAAAILLLVFAAAATGSVLTLSRGGLLNLGFTTTMAFAFALRFRTVPRSRKIVVGLGIAAFATVLTVYFSRTVMMRIAEMALQMEGDERRAAQIAQALDMIMANPVTGVGPGNYINAMGAYGPVLPYPVHNKFLLVTAEAGVPGGLMYVLLWTSTLYVVVRQAMSRGGAEGVLHGAAAAAIVGTLLNMNTDVYGAGSAPELSLFLVAGLALGFGGRQLEPQARARPAWNPPWNRSALVP